MKVQLLDPTGKVVLQSAEVPDAPAYAEYAVNSGKVYKFRTATGVVSDPEALGCYVEEASVVVVTAGKGATAPAEAATPPPPPAVPPVAAPPPAPGAPGSATKKESK